MTNLFLLHASEDAACAKTLCAGLAIQGYRIWREPHSLQVSDLMYPHTIENAILGSAVVLLLLSIHAVYSTNVARHLTFAIDLKKNIIPLILGKMDLPAMLQSFTPCVVQPPCRDIVAQLTQQSLLPPPDSTDPLIKLAESAASDLRAKRKAAVQQASTMLQRNQQRPAVLAILAYLAQDDPMSEVHEPAQEALNADARRQQTLHISPSLPAHQNHTGPMIVARCKKCNHVTYFDKHSIYQEFRPVMRGDNDNLKLKCESCGAMMMVQIDCEGYI